MDQRDALQRAGGVWRGRLPEREVSFDGPPYQVIAADFLLHVVSLDPEGTKAVLPKGLCSSREPTGLIGFYRATSGAGLAPYSGCFIAVEVRGYDAPDDSSVFVKVAGWYSGRAGHVMHDVYDTRLLAGEVRHWQHGDCWGAEAGPAGRYVVSTEVRRTGEDAPLTSGTHHFIGAHRQEGINFYSTSFTQSFVEAECLGLEIHPEAPPALKALNPRSQFCYYSPTAFLTFGRPQQLAVASRDGAADAARMMLLDVFLRLGRAAVVVGQDGRVLYLNRKAEELAGDGFVITGQHLRAISAADQPAFSAAIIQAFSGKQTIEPIPLQRTKTTVPLLARAMPMDHTTLGDKAVLVLLTDPLDNGGAGVVKMLRLLGLSQAEARVAVLVGTGLSPKDVAAELGLAESTIRSALKTTYDKLAISRQSELAQMVARLGAL